MYLDNFLNTTTIKWPPLLTTTPTHIFLLYFSLFFLNDFLSDDSSFVIHHFSIGKNVELKNHKMVYSKYIIHHQQEQRATTTPHSSFILTLISTNSLFGKFSPPLIQIPCVISLTFAIPHNNSITWMTTNKRITALCQEMLQWSEIKSNQIKWRIFVWPSKDYVTANEHNTGKSGNEGKPMV